MTLGFSLNHASSIPAFQGLRYILDVYTGHSPASLAWLWEQYYENRHVLSKLILAVLWRLSGGNLWVTQVLNVLVLAASSALLVMAARRIRGRTIMADAFFPLVFLRWGQYETLFLYYFIPSLHVALVSGVMFVMARQPGRPPFGLGAFAGVCIALLPLCGIAAETVLLPLVIWLAWMGYVHVVRRGKGSGSNPRAGTLYLALAITAVAITAASFVGYGLQRNLAPSPGILAALRCTAEYLSMSLGDLGRMAWPFSAVVVAAVWLATAWKLAMAVRARAGDRFRIAGLIAVSAGLLLHALALGWGRSGIGAGAGFIATRYVTYASLIASAIYISWVVLERSEGRSLIQRAFFIVACVTLPFDMRAGLTLAEARYGVMRELEDDIRRGLPVPELAARHWPYYNISEREGLKDLEMMEQARMGPFRDREAVRPISRAFGSRASSAGVLGEHAGRVRTVRFAARGPLVASAGDDGSIRLWDSRSGQARSVLLGHVGVVSMVAYSPDGKLLASAGWDGTVRLWDAATGRLRLRQQVDSKEVCALAFSPNGRHLAVGAWDGLVRVWDAGLKTAVRSLVYLEGEVLAIAFAPRGDLLATAGWAGTAKIALWEAGTGRMKCELAGHGGTVSSLAFSPDGKFLASAGWDRTVRLWDPAGCTGISILRGHTGVVTSVTFSPSGGLLATGSRDGTVRLWDVATGRERTVLRGHEGYVSSVSFSDDGRMLASGGWDGTVRLWKVAGQNPI